MDTLYLEKLEDKYMMAAYIYSDPEISNLINKDYIDNVIDRTEMMEIFRSSSDNGSVDKNEFADIKNIVNLNMSEDIKYLSNNMMNNTTNKKVSALHIGSSSNDVSSLIDKWFLGKDRPEISAGLTYKPVNGQLTINGINEQDIKQGNIGDCYFMASIAALASKNSKFVEQTFKYNNDNTWTVTFYKLDTTRYIKEFVVVDNYLPVNKYGYSYYANFGKYYTDKTNELWPALLEKAYAQWSETGHAVLPNDTKTNSYANIGNGGWSNKVFSQFTGSYVSNNIGINTSAEINIKSALSANKPVVIYRYMDTNHTIGHAYFIKSYSNINGKYELFNPWGFSHLNLNSYELQSSCYGYAICSKIS